VKRRTNEQVMAPPLTSADDDFDGGPTGEELARRAQRGSLAAYAELLARYEGRLFNFLLRRVGNVTDAEELTQETFVRAWERIDRYDDRWKFSTWLFTIGLRLAVSQHRSAQRARRSELPEHRLADARANDPSAVAASREAGTPTWDLAARVLTDAQHTALWLRYAEGLSMKEIARVMGKSQVSVRVTLFRARDHLAAHLLKRRDEQAASRRAAGAASDSAVPECPACMDTWVMEV
jgi:RNA polymerase sigma-70 factor (ECF subfamily)